MSGSLPQISVILPFFNAARTLNSALQSIAVQDLTNFECIMIDNNSSDGSREIALQWESSDQRFKMVEEVRQGVMFASNRGCEVALGKYIARMDADDVARPRRLSLQASFLDAHPELLDINKNIIQKGWK